MYRGYEIISEAAFRVTRNSNLYLQEEESRNLLESVRTELHNRRKGDAVRLEIEADANPEIIERLRGYFELEDWQVYRTNGPVNLSRLLHLYEETDRPDLKFKPFVPRELQLNRKSQDICSRRCAIATSCCIIRSTPTTRWCPSSSTAAEDPNVLSIKQTLYRTSENSPIVRALIDAAREQGSDGGGGAEGALRRGLQHSLGARAGRCRRAGLSRPGRTEDALQAGADGAPGSRRGDAALRAPGHRQLQLDHRAVSTPT